MTTMQQFELKNAFSKVGLKVIDEATMSKCTAAATMLRLSPQQVATCWEAYSLKKNTTTLNEQSFEGFRDLLVKESNTVNNNIPMSDEHNNNNNKESPRGGAVLPPRSLPHVTPPAKRLQLAAVTNNTNTEPSSRRSSSLSPGPPVALQPSDKYETRIGAGQIVSTFTAEHKRTATNDNPLLSRPKCTIRSESSAFSTNNNNLSQAYRSLFTTTEQRATALDQQLIHMGQHLMEKYQLGQSDEVAPLEGVGIPRADQVCNIGRICNAAHYGKINATSVLLEGSRAAVGGARVAVDLSTLSSQYSVFPGQIVALEGMNPTGRKLQVQRLCEGAAAAPVTSRVRDLRQYHLQAQQGQPVKLLTAAGPFTTSDNFQYQPWQDLLHVVQNEQPDVVILTGPFVDMNHPAVQSGQTALQDEDGNDVIVPYETFFMHKISLLLEELLTENPLLMTQFVLVPSLEDATAEWVYPQPPFQDRVSGGLQPNIPGADGITIGTMGLDYVETATELPAKRVHCVPNPCTLQINEVVIGITSTDVLFHMSADETNANLPPGSRLARISQHLLQQRSYYPLFPPAPGMNMDYQYMEYWSMPCQPDLLLLPSKLACFSRIVMDTTIVVNPGRLTRDTMGGTYAIIEVHPFAKDVLETADDDDELPHALPERTEVIIKRI
ncbi:DNA polymerase alpha subunit B [Fistulifera solaris]|uniref:DNA polymerase alpha subunit B n=1 Tax=Fistulifera solaris TaxID=1519565 RepID=A0A1Z5K576_FISSO|nr:DNA polymerase alpha subunit B [Fistulifera solaris]|eukprot:GAX21359.1 DNA polymerase alpha subunit B [Fistulifera solaris]